jgi:hypothetical protein
LLDDQSMKWWNKMRLKITHRRRMFIGHFDDIINKEFIFYLMLPVWFKKLVFYGIMTTFFVWYIFSDDPFLSAYLIINFFITDERFCCCISGIWCRGLWMEWLEMLEFASFLPKSTKIQIKVWWFKYLSRGENNLMGNLLEIF